MTPFFFDSSGLAKRYAQETGTDWVRSVTDPGSGNRILISEITKVEVVNALMKKERTGEMTADEVELSTNRFLLHLRDQYHLVPIRSSMIDEAVRLVRSYTLRAYDAVQLATAVELNRTGNPSGTPLLIFVSADDPLNTAAQAEGLLVANPSSQ
ncbi:MAG: type II toxin-antitoxin system VapC family toxin [Armatimonadetes bacterium]|nr:type II toxin-antitoxin system VapC family toxin [Armatimonadota bacterium]